MAADSSCPECGASQRDGSCRDQLRRALLDELTEGDASYALAVACFTLQHPAAQSAASLAWARFHVEGCLTAPSGRAGLLARASSHVEAMSSPLPARGHRVPIGVVWRVTVADLIGLAPGSVERTHAWARSTFEDLRAAE